MKWYVRFFVLIGLSILLLKVAENWLVRNTSYISTIIRHIFTLNLPNLTLTKILLNMPCIV